MKTLLTVLVTAVITVAAFLWISVNHPEWLIKLQYDSDGFPRIKKRGDRFVLSGQNYTYDGTMWVKVGQDWFPLNPKQGDSFVVNGIGYTFDGTKWVVISGPSDYDTSAERMQSNGRFIDGVFVPFSTIDVINALNPGLRAKCQRKSGVNLQTGQTYTYYLYNGFEVTAKDCADHGAL